MDTKPYTLIIEKLNNENDLINLVKETEECFYLDYKQGEKDDYSQSRSIKGPDLDNIAKSISGFGNALGGILIFGVDKHKNLKPFKGYKIFESLVQESVSRSTNPHHEKIETLSIQSTKEQEKGYVVIIIHQSHNRPLQVITNSNTHRYFYRTGESHIDIPHDVLAGMFGKKIPVILSIQYQVKLNEDTSTNNKFEFAFIIRNNSSVIAKDVWFNMDLGIPNTAVVQGNSFNLFMGHKMADSISVITVKDYRLPPQGYISPISLSILKNNLKDNQDYHLYFTFGCEGSKINEFESTFKGCEFNKLLNSDAKELLNFLKEHSTGIIEKI